MSQVYRGYFKLIEEIGELLTIMGKLGPFPQGEHPDGNGHLQLRLFDELADVQAAQTYFMSSGNAIPVGVANYDFSSYTERVRTKLEKFNHWGLTGIEPMQPPPNAIEVPAEVVQTLVDAGWVVVGHHTAGVVVVEPPAGSRVNG